MYRAISSPLLAVNTCGGEGLVGGSIAGRKVKQGPPRVEGALFRGAECSGRAGACPHDKREQ